MTLIAIRVRDCDFVLVHPVDPFIEFSDEISAVRVWLSIVRCCRNGRRRKV